MFKDARVLFLYAETPLHAGGGASLGFVDLPIQREKHTMYPLVQASGIKGALRELVDEKTKVTENLKKKKKELIEIKEEIKKNPNDSNLKAKKDVLEDEVKKIPEDIYAVFGPEDGDKFGGCVSFTDAKILLLPVRSLKGVFAWVTCPDVLERFKMHLKSANIDLEFNIPKPGKNTYISGSELLLNSKNGKGKIVLEEFTFEAEENEYVKKIAEYFSNNVLPIVKTEKNQNATDNDAYEYWREKLKKNLVVLPDDYFRYFAEHSTEIVTRIKIGENGVVQRGGLWQEENLPSDSLLYSVAMASDPFGNGSIVKSADSAIDFLKTNVNDTVFQLGGNSTTGRGLVRVTIPEGIKNG